MTMATLTNRHSKHKQLLLLLLSFYLQQPNNVDAFSFGMILRGGGSSSLSSSSSSSNHPPSPPTPPPGNHNLFQYGNYDDDGNNGNNNGQLVAASILGICDDVDDVETVQEDAIGLMENETNINANANTNTNVSTTGCISNNSNDTLHTIRGGNEDILVGAKSTIQSSTHYWSKTFPTKLQTTLQRLNPFHSKSKQQQQQKDEDANELLKIPIQKVEAPTSTILPDTILRSAAQRSGLIGSTLKPQRVNELAKQIKKWYLQRGYVLHAVTGATLHPENATASLTVQEPKMAKQPMDIQFAKVVPIDPMTGEVSSMRTIKRKFETKRGGRKLNVEEWTKVKESLNSTLIEAKGRTNPNTISKRLGLIPGKHFKWDSAKWSTIANSGIFTRIFRASPVRLQDGSVQLQVVAQESPPRNLEYGIQKSLYTGNWEGELDFKHENILGGGESLGLSVRRGAKDPQPSVRIQFTDDKFGREGGYSAQIFNEYMTMAPSKKKVKVTKDDVDNIEGEGEGESYLKGEEEENDMDEMLTQPVISSETYHDDEIQSRKGIRFNLRTPISTKLMQRSSASTSLERTSTRTGRHETITSGTIGFGPVIRNLPLGAKTSVSSSVTSGTRIGGTNDNSSWTLSPYSSQVSKMRQIFPIFSQSLSLRDGEEVKLALETTCMSSTRHLPRHEANAAGLAASVRGYSSSSNGPLSGSLYGSAEVRIPVTIPFQKDKLNQDGKVVLFGDWMVGIKKREGLSTISPMDESNIVKRSSVGIGLRKSIQGIPLKYDVSLNKDGKLGAFVSLGQDWNIE